MLTDHDKPRRRIVFIRGELEQAIVGLLQHPNGLLTGQASVSRTPGQIDLLGGRLRAASNMPAFSGIAVVRHPHGVARWVPPLLLERSADRNPAPEGALGLIILELESSPPVLRAFLSTPDGVFKPVDEVLLVGRGMHTLRPSNAATRAQSVAVPGDEAERWSRVAGALGKDAWRRLRRLRSCVVGVGRSGSAMAESLWKLGMHEITLIDADLLELANLDSMSAVFDHDLGIPKVQAVHRGLNEFNHRGGEIREVVAPIDTLQSLEEIKRCDVLISCVDNDAARLLSAIAATLYAKVFLDIGTGVLGAGRGREIGCDVRLIVPGDGCLSCLGGVADRERALAALDPSAPSDGPSVPWFVERAGSLRSVNQIAVHFGLRLLEGLVTERVNGSTWLHVEFDGDDIPHVDSIRLVRPRSCGLCRRTAAGDAGLQELETIRAQLAAS